MFFGYDLPDYITEEDIVSFLEEFEQVIVDVEVVSNEKHGNYARVTFKTSADAHEAMRHYSGQYWYELGVHVVLKPWKEKEMPHKKKQQHREHTLGESDITYDGLNVSGKGLQLSKPCSSTASFLLPYPESHQSKMGKPIYSEGEANSTDLENKQEKLTGSGGPHKEYYPKEYTIKLSGLSIDVREEEILQLVKPFGDLTSPVRIARFPENGICYAYANYYTSNSAVTAVSELDESEFKGVRIHVCHKGELGVDHSCRKILQELAEEEYDNVSIASYDDHHSRKYTIKISGLSFDVRKGHIKKLVKPFGDLAGPVRIASYPENGICYAYVDYCNSGSAIEAVLKLDKSDFSGNKIHVCHKGELEVDHSCRKILQKWAKESKEEYDDNTTAYFDSVKQVHNMDPPQVTSQESDEKSRTVTSYASVTKSPPKPVKDLHEKKPSKVATKKSKSATNVVDASPERSNVNSSYHSDKSSHERKDLTKDGRELGVLSIDCLPGSDTISTEKQVSKVFENVPSYASITQTSPKAVKIPHEEKPICILTQEPEFSSDNIESSVATSHDVYYQHKGLNELQPSSIPYEGVNFEDASIHVPLIIFPHNQLTDVFKDVTPYAYTAQSSPQDVSIVQDVNPASVLQQQPKTHPDNAKSSCILEVTNLHPDASVQDLERYFKPYGTLTAPISIRFHPASDSCSAVVHYNSPDAAQNAMIRLNGCDFSGYQMRIVSAGHKDTDVKVTVDKIPVISGSKTVDDIAIVGPLDLHIPAKSMGESTLFSNNESSTTLSNQ